ncbi:MAG TPA: DUF998 domain-containing protein, partial [Gemmatimonadaceae bacterium]|nr:DUF998 domain-containing protein [Gemmatimonadaceae bacterium]
MLISVPLQWDGYSSASQTVSELSAIDAPTRSLWVPLGFVYSMLVIAFGWGVATSVGRNRSVRVVGGLLIAYGVIGLFWPPMHLRGAELTLTDTMHIVFSIVVVLLMLLAIGFGAAAFGKRFRRYSIATLVVLVVFGTLTGVDGPRIAANLPTPWMGVWERINIGAFLLWVAVLAVELLRRPRSGGATLTSVMSTTNLQGMVAPGFEEVRVEFERNFAERGEIGAAVAAYWRGEKVVDLWG